jgi:FkbM family methyltransferase
MEIWHGHCYDAVALDASRCVVDVGANIAAFSLYQAMIRHAELVIAFEPSPDVFRRLAKTVEIKRTQQRANCKCSRGRKNRSVVLF